MSVFNTIRPRGQDLRRTHGHAPVKRFMTPMPHAIEPHESLATAETRMAELHVLHLPVRAAGRLVGIVSDRDILLAKAIPGVNPTKTEVSWLMIADPYAIEPETPLADVCAAMAERKLGSALVVDRDGHLLGIFTTTDALHALADLVR